MEGQGRDYWASCMSSGAETLVKAMHDKGGERPGKSTICRRQAGRKNSIIIKSDRLRSTSESCRPHTVLRINLDTKKKKERSKGEPCRDAHIASFRFWRSPHDGKRSRRRLRLRCPKITVLPGHMLASSCGTGEQ